VFDEEGPVIVQHRLYRGASAPDRYVVKDFDELTEHLAKRASAGDIIDVWSFAKC
jgi:hypothetical protein